MIAAYVVAVHRNEEKLVRKVRSEVQHVHVQNLVLNVVFTMSSGKPLELLEPSEGQKDKTICKL